jgi:5-methylthioadenosine/S-adenosylhomocysteine deaminase
LESTIGSIEVGKDADLIAINLDALHLLPIHNLLALLVYSVGRGDVSDVFVAGQHVVRARQLANVNVAELERRVNERTVALAHLR